MTTAVKKSIYLLLFISLLLPLTAFSSEEEISEVFSSAEKLFMSMRDRNYVLIWQSLTNETQQKTTHSIFRDLAGKGINLDRAAIANDFEAGGKIAKAYWDAYLSIFDPDDALSQSQWSIKKLKKDVAEINVHYKKSENTAVIKLYRQHNVWKVGLEESFGARRLIPFK